MIFSNFSFFHFQIWREIIDIRSSFTHSLYPETKRLLHLSLPLSLSLSLSLLIVSIMYIAFFRLPFQLDNHNIYYVISMLDHTVVFPPYCTLNIVIKERNQTSKLLSFQSYKVCYVFYVLIKVLKLSMFKPKLRLRACLLISEKYH